jgi:DNA mismatch repair protein MutS
LGLGFFDKCDTSTFDYIHCYLNIPDSCSRDSLFQAEARRCKDILDCIIKYPKKKHFCIFDELYSGTNPYEAISSAYSYLNYISKNDNVRFLLTTHYIKLCRLFEEKTTKKINVINKSMKTLEDISKNQIYTYKVTKGVSTIKGGVSVLKNLGYPKKIIDLTLDILEQI